MLYIKPYVVLFIAALFDLVIDIVINVDLIQSQ